MSNSILRERMFISALVSRVNSIIFELADDPIYTKEEAIADLSEVVEMLEQNYPRLVTPDVNVANPN